MDKKISGETILISRPAPLRPRAGGEGLENGAVDSGAIKNPRGGGGFLNIISGRRTVLRCSRSSPSSSSRSRCL